MSDFLFMQMRSIDASRPLVLALRTTAVALDRLAERLDARRAPARLSSIEFHAEAGAPEGALYVDGHFAGWIDGVRRL